VRRPTWRPGYPRRGPSRGRRPLLMVLEATIIVVSGFITTRQRARALRGPTSDAPISRGKVLERGVRRDWWKSSTPRCYRVLLTTSGTVAATLPTPSKRESMRCLRTSTNARAATAEARWLQKFTDAALTACTECSGELRKVFSAVGVVFKGSGFYKTDSRGSSFGRQPGVEFRVVGHDEHCGRGARRGDPSSASSTSSTSGN
jgi:predicted nucleic acid-binding Zn ribbon protein